MDSSACASRLEKGEVLLDFRKYRNAVSSSAKPKHQRGDVNAAEAKPWRGRGGSSSSGGKARGEGKQQRVHNNQQKRPQQ